MKVISELLPGQGAAFELASRLSEPPFYGFRRRELQTNKQINLHGFATVGGLRKKEIESFVQWMGSLFEAESPKREDESWYVPTSFTNTGDREADLVALLQDSIVLTRTMEAAARSSDTIDLSNAAFELKDTLDELWKFRRATETDWGDLLHMLQSCIFADVKFERLSVPKCIAIRKVLKLLSGPTVGLDELDSADEYLTDAGFDPWAVVSPKDSEEN